MTIRKFVSGGVTSTGVTYRSEIWRDAPAWDAKEAMRLMSAERPTTIRVSGDFIRALREEIDAQKDERGAPQMGVK